MPPSKPTEIELIKQLKARILELRKDPNPPPSTTGLPEWKHFVDSLCNSILNDDPRRFLRWKVIKKTMFVSNANCVEVELRSLLKSYEWEQKWKTALHENHIGHPLPYYAYPKSSGNLIHQAYSLSEYTRHTAVNIENMNLIVEFGGGYGSMCHLIHKLGFSGRYVIFDFPEFLALQSFYLQANNITTRKIDDFNDMSSGVFFLSETDLLADLMEKSTTINISDNNQNCFIATWSISESPKCLRNKILSSVGNFNYFLIAYQDNFGNINNINWFQSWQYQFNKNICWSNIEIAHLPNNFYLLGKNKKYNNTLT